MAAAAGATGFGKTSRRLVPSLGKEGSSETVRRRGSSAKQERRAAAGSANGLLAPLFAGEAGARSSQLRRTKGQGRRDGRRMPIVFSHGPHRRLSLCSLSSRPALLLSTALLPAGPSRNRARLLPPEALGRAQNDDERRKREERSRGQIPARSALSSQCPSGALLSSRGQGRFLSSGFAEHSRIEQASPAADHE